MKKMIFFIFLIITSFTFVSATQLPVEISADGVALLDLNQSKFVYEKNADKQEVLASLTKIMTCYTVLQRESNLNKKITILESDFDGLLYYTKFDLEAGETFSVKDYLYTMMLYSDALSAQVLARHVAGSNENFKDMMNEEARKLGLFNTHFEDPYGGSEFNISTPREFARLLQMCLENQMFKKIFTTTSYILPNGKQVDNYTRSSATFHGFDDTLLTGNKPGFTDEAGLCLASTATINGTNYALILMKSDVNQYYTQHIIETYKVFDYVKENVYHKRVLLNKGEILKTIPVVDGTTDEYVVTTDEEISMILSDKDYESIEYDYRIADKITPLNRKGDILGFVDILLNGEVVETYNVYLKEEIYRYVEPSKIIVLIIIALAFLIIVLFGVNLLSKRKY